MSQPETQVLPIPAEPTSSEMADQQPDESALVRPPSPYPSSPVGEPLRPWTIWLAATTGYVTAALAVLVLAWVYLLALDPAGFAQAARLFGWWPSTAGSALRVWLAVAAFGLTLAIAIPSVIAAYYSWIGYRWTRWFGISAAVLSGAVFLLEPAAELARPLVWATITTGVATAVLLWLPATRRFFDAWLSHRYPPVTVAGPPAPVHYGPLPRYR